MSDVLISIQPKWCALILNGTKTIEVRKSAPRLKTPFRCYIYCTKSGRPLVYGDRPCAGGWAEEYCQTYGYSREEAGRIWDVLNGKVIGEFVCDGIQDITYCDDGEHQHYQWIDAPKWAFFLNQEACLNDEELKKYLGNKDGYGWHISDLKIYDEPLNLKDLHRNCSTCGYVYARDGNCDFIIKRPPQSWCYVEGLG